MDEHSPARKVHGSLLRDKRTRNLAPRPEKVLHAAPGVLRVGTKIARAVLAHRKPGRGLRESDVDDTALVHTALDVVALAVLRNLHAAALARETLLILTEGEVAEVVGGPELGALRGVDDLGVELGGGADAEDVAVDDLDEAEAAVVGGHVEGLGLDVGRVHDLPAEVVFCELGVGDILGLLCDGLDGFGAVLALGDADAGRDERSARISGGWRLGNLGVHGGSCLRAMREEGFIEGCRSQAQALGPSCSPEHDLTCQRRKD